MLTADEYYNQSLDLFERIYLYQEDAIKKLDDISDAAQSIFFTVDESIKSSTKSYGSTESPLFTKIDSLITKVDKLVNRISGIPDGSTNTENVSAKIASTLAKDISGVGKDLLLSVPYFSVVRPFIPTIAGVINDLVNIVTNNLSTIKEEDVDKIDSITNLIGVKYLDFAKQMYSAIPYLKAVQPFASFIGKSIGTVINGLVNGINMTLSEEQAKSTAVVINAFGSGILKFAKDLAKATPIMTIASVGVPIFNYSIKALILTFKEIGENAKDIKDGSSGLNSISTSLLVFSGSLALSTLALATIGLEGFGYIALTAVTLGLLAAEFAVIGLVSDQVKDGSWAVVGMSASLLVFSASLLVSSAFVSSVSPMAMLGLGASLVAFGAIFSIAGVFESEILAGAFAFGMIALSLFALSFPLSTIGNSISQNPMLLIQVPTMLTALGAVYALAGAGIEFILPGAIAIGAIGLSLIPLAYSLQKMSEISNFDESKANGIKLAIEAVVMGFGNSFKDLGIGAIGKMYLAVPLIGLMGLSMSSLASGLSDYKSKANGWNTTDSSTVRTTIEDLSIAFASVGGSEGSLKILGIPMTKSDVQRGIDVTNQMGFTLSSLSSGIQKWKSMSLKPQDAQLISDNISTMLNIIPGAFAVVGARERESNYSGLQIGAIKIPNPFEKGDVELGISATKDIGKTLESLHNGVIAWTGKIITPQQALSIAQNIRTVLDVVPMAFASIGIREKGSKSGIQIGAISLPNPFEQGDVTAGISSVKDMGQVLMDIHQSLEVWNPTKGMTPEIINKISNNIRSFLVSVPSAFAAIGKINKDSDSFFDFDGGDIDKGIELVTSLMPQLIKISEVAKNFADSQQAPLNITNTTDALFKSFDRFIIFGKDQESLESFNLGLTQLAKWSGYLKASTNALAPYNTQLEKFIQNWDKLSKLSTPIDKLSKSMDGFTKILKEQNKLFDPKEGGGSVYVKFIEGVLKLEKVNTTAIAENLQTIASYGTRPAYNYESSAPTVVENKAPVVKTVKSNEVISGTLEQKLDQLIMLMSSQIKMQQEGSANKDIVTAVNDLKLQLITLGIKVKT